jgi:outer membrane protein assembly factor BamE (lipoprotein component of BamABCDE complex)
MRIHVALISLLNVVLLTGCISPGQRLEPEVVRQIKEGSSTRADVEKLLGKPRSIVVGSSERKIAHYGYTRRIESAEFQLIGAFAKNPGDILSRHFTAMYNQQNIVEKALFHQSLTPFAVGFGRMSAGQIISPDTLRQIKKGVSTKDDIVKLLGEPTLVSLNSDGDLAMIWFYAKSQMRWPQNRNDNQTLSVTFDDAGLVKDHTLSGNLETL